MMQAFFLAMYSLVFLTTFSTVYCSNDKGLYTLNDHVVIFNSTSYEHWESSRLDQAYWIQYYSASCGDCRRYSSVFKIFSASVWDWRDTVKIAVINCDQYGSICARNVKSGVPQNKYYKRGPPPHQGKELPHGEVFHENPGPLQRILLDAMKDLPLLQPITQEEAGKKANGAVIIEDNEGFLARKVILGLHEFKKPANIFWLKGGEKYISVYQVVNQSLVKKFSSLVPKAQRWDFERKVAVILGVPSPTPPPVVQMAVPKIPSYYRPNIQFIDIYSSIRAFTSHEVILKNIIKGLRLQALKDFIQIISVFYKDVHERNKDPRVKVVAGNLVLFFKNLSEMLAERKSITNMEWKNWYATSEKKYNLPDVKKWSNCAPSIPNRRRFPCGVWIFFHSILRLNRVYGEKYGFKDPTFVLKTIRNMVKEFFDCDNCRRHFVSATKDMLKKVRSREDAMIYVWRIHNGVNKRLSKFNFNGNDPYFPKVQFPTEKECSDCGASPNYKIKEVTDFLVRYFDSATYPLGPRWPQDDESERYNTTEILVHPSPFDFTVCGFMSVVCTALAIMFFLLFYRRRLYCFSSRTTRINGKVITAHMA